MDSVSNESFLLSCIKHAGGTIDFGQVAKDCGATVTRNAATKRFKRIKDKHDATASSSDGAAVEPSPSPEKPAGKKGKAGGSAKAGKKRKLSQAEEAEEAEDGEAAGDEATSKEEE